MNPLTTVKTFAILLALFHDQKAGAVSRNIVTSLTNGIRPVTLDISRPLARAEAELIERRVRSLESLLVKKYLSPKETR